MPPRYLLGSIFPNEARRWQAVRDAGLAIGPADSWDDVVRRLGPAGAALPAADPGDPAPAPPGNKPLFVRAG
jgi:hypothetical protein